MESAGGSGLSQVLGLGDFTNADATLSPSLNQTPYIARAELHQLIPLSNDRVQVERTPISLLTQLPPRRIDFYAGKLSTVDFFDTNSVASDSHMQFMNWCVVDTCAYDYAADTRGYTWGVMADFVDRWWSFRFGEAFLSKRPNGMTLQKNLQDAHSENYEIDVWPGLFKGKNTAIGVLAFTNFANMGVYHQAISRFLDGTTPTPEIDDHLRQTSLKYGFAMNGAQDLGLGARGFIRLGWNEGQHESWN